MRYTVPWQIGFATNRPSAALIGDEEVTLPNFAPEIAVAVLGEVSRDLSPARIRANQLLAWVCDDDPEVPVACIVALRTQSDLELLQAAAADLKQQVQHQGFSVTQWLVTSECSTTHFVITKVWYKGQSK